MRLLYWNVERIGLFGSRYRSFSTNCSLVKLLEYQTRSCRGSPLRCVTMSRVVNCSVVTGSYIRNPGRYSRTGLSQSSFPWSASVPSDVTVNDLVMDAIGNSVVPVTGRLRATLRYPYPLARRTLPSLTTATAAPGTLNSCIAFAMKSSNPSKLPLVIVGAAAESQTAAAEQIERGSQ